MPFEQFDVLTNVPERRRPRKKIFLYGRMIRGLDDALGLYQRQGAARRAEVGAA